MSSIALTFIHKDNSRLIEANVFKMDSVTFCIEGSDSRTVWLSKEDHTPVSFSFLNGPKLFWPLDLETYVRWKEFDVFFNKRYLYDISDMRDTWNRFRNFGISSHHGTEKQFSGQKELIVAKGYNGRRGRWLPLKKQNTHNVYDYGYEDEEDEASAWGMIGLLGAYMGCESSTLKEKKPVLVSIDKDGHVNLPSDKQ
jgi:hypothetical protein